MDQSRRESYGEDVAKVKEVPKINTRFGEIFLGKEIRVVKMRRSGTARFKIEGETAQSRRFLLPSQRKLLRMDSCKLLIQ